MLDIQWKYAKNPHSGKTVSIDEANKLNKSTKFKPDYRCLDCDSPMITKKGAIKRHHFSHLADEERSSCKGEGARHWTVKIETARYLKSKENVIKGIKIISVNIEKRDHSGLISDIKLSYIIKDSKVNILHIEIVDSNPPNERKIHEFKDKMLIFEIKNFSNEKIADKHFFGDFALQLQDFISNMENQNRELSSLKKKCEKLKRNGERCKNWPIKSTKYCPYHTPGHIVLRRRNFMKKITKASKYDSDFQREHK